MIKLGPNISASRAGFLPLHVVSSWWPGQRQRAGTAVHPREQRAASALAQTEMTRRLLDSLKLCHSRVLAAVGEHEHFAIATCSAFEGEGKTTLAVTLAEMLAKDFPRQILLIDANLERPRIHSLLNLAGSPGLKDCLDENTLVVEAIRWSGVHWVMPAGNVMAPSASLTWEGQRSLLRPLKELFRVTIIDMPATLPNPQAVATLAPWVDALIWVVQAESSPADLVAEAMDIAGREKLIGIVLNKRRPALPGWLQKLT